MTSAFPEADRRTLRTRLAAALSPGWRTRFAPAPTGYLHLGHAVNAVYVWSIARAFGGHVIVRIEDHDRQRSRNVYEQSIRADLAWLGLDGDNAALGLPEPLRQRDREDTYVHALAGLTARGLVYACRCSRREIAALGDGSDELRYPGTCRTAAIPPDATPARRLVLTESPVTFEDLRHGTLTQVPARQCGDLLLRDRHAQWTYQFAVVVDDLQQQVDLIIRGDDLLASTGRQHALGALLSGTDRFPRVLHHPLVRHPDGAKLSKSRGDAGLAELRDAGWSAARVLGHAAWLAGLQPTDMPVPTSDLARLWA